MRRGDSEVTDAQGTYAKDKLVDEGVKTYACFSPQSVTGLDCGNGMR